MIKDVHSLSLADILPQNLMADKQLAAVAQTLDAKFQAATAATIKTLILPRLDELPEDIIDLLAWQWHVDFYEPVGMDIDTKRRLVRESVGWHHIKGTPAAVEKMIQTVYQTGIVQEWPEYDGLQYYFRVLLGESVIQTEKLKLLLKMIDASKNTRSWLEMLIFEKNTDASIYYGAFCEVHKQYHLAQKTTTGGEMSATVYYGSGQSIYKHIEARPKFATNAETEADLHIGSGQSIYKHIEARPKFATDAETEANLHIGGSETAHNTVGLLANVTDDMKTTANVLVASGGVIHKIVNLHAET